MYPAALGAWGIKFEAWKFHQFQSKKLVLVHLDAPLPANSRRGKSAGLSLRWDRSKDVWSPVAGKCQLAKYIKICKTLHCCMSWPKPRTMLKITALKFWVMKQPIPPEHLFVVDLSSQFHEIETVKREKQTNYKTVWNYIKHFKTI